MLYVPKLIEYLEGKGFACDRLLGLGDRFANKEELFALLFGILTAAEWHAAVRTVEVTDPGELFVFGLGI